MRATWPPTLVAKHGPCCLRWQGGLPLCAWSCGTLARRALTHTHARLLAVPRPPATRRRPRAASASSPQSQARFAATFEDVYSASSLQVPWYITSGFHDWEGNVTGAPRRAARKTWTRVMGGRGDARAGTCAAQRPASHTLQLRPCGAAPRRNAAGCRLQAAPVCVARSWSPNPRAPKAAAITLVAATALRRTQCSD